MSKYINNKKRMSNIVSESFGGSRPDEDEEVYEYEVEVEPDDMIALEPDFVPEPQQEPDMSLDVHPDNDNVAVSELIRLRDTSTKLEQLATNGQLDNWMVAKVVKASDYIEDVLKSMEAKEVQSQHGCDHGCGE